ncbi:Fic family protein, partial [Candidatus Gracilibacteria bacterium]|nr:Fic family protein [Candidatus Gracilibacteria bacterium]
KYMEVGKNIKQASGFKAFIPSPFPPKNGYSFSPQIIEKANKATLLLGKLDGITELLPDVNYFIFMYIRKDASSSSQIEGTQATMIDLIEAEANVSTDIPDDVDDILHYIEALKYGTNRLKDFPISLRVIKEIHSILLSNARSSHFSNPGHFRESQNWIGGTRPDNAKFVPPPIFEMNRALDELENFFHSKSQILPILKAGLIHSQFETIHPFLDGNGRTGRILITLFLWLENILEKPVLFLSSFFHKHKKLYYEKLDSYHNNNIEDWLDFFLEGVIETSLEAIETVKRINILRDEDMRKIQCLSKASSETSMKILQELFQLPITNVPNIQKITGFTRQGAQKVLDRFVELGILEIKKEDSKYGRSYVYKKYQDIFYYEK